jgi:hypothetical protein
MGVQWGVMGVVEILNGHWEAPGALGMVRSDLTSDIS